MAQALYKNNAKSTLASGITDVATSISLTATEGARFPSPTGADYFYATLIDTSNNLEIVKCTSRSTDTLTVVRGAESTSNIAYSAGDRIELRVTAAGLTENVVSAAASAVAAQSSEDDAAVDLVLTNADVVLTHADVVLTHADVVLAEADKVQTGLDRIATAADVVLTHADVVLTHADVVLTNADVVLAEADKVQTGLDRIATAADLVATNQDTIDTAADLVATNQDTIDTAASLVLVEAAVAAVALGYTFSTTTTMADPGTGLIRFNNATLASVTAIAIDDLSADTGNPDVSDFIGTWDDPVATNKGFLQIVEEGTLANFAIFLITGLTDNTGWTELAVTYLDSNVGFANTDSLRLAYSRAGATGATGSTGATGATGATGPVGVGLALALGG